jgi:hypothetical protein
MTPVRGLVGSSVAVLIAFGFASSALAAGGQNIASAPVPYYGVQEFGNTSSDNGEDPGVPYGCPGGDSSWWKIPVKGGDQITVDFEGNADTMLVYPVGTTDFNVQSTHSLRFDTAGNDKQQARFYAPRDGWRPIDFFACGNGGAPGPGPYDFTAYVRHGLALQLKASGYASHQTKFYLRVDTPDGEPVNSKSLIGDVQRQDAQEGNRWITSFHVYPSKPYNGKWNFSYHWMRYMQGRSVNVRVVVHGPGYRTTTSNATQVKAF